MKSLNQIPSFELIYLIVNDGMGSKVLKKAKEFGIHGGTVFYGKGTVNNSFLKFLSLHDERKEIILLGAHKATAHTALAKMNKHFKFAKPNKGIAFSISLTGIVGSRGHQCEIDQKEKEENKSMYQLILTIVNRGRAEDVIEAATAAGSKGGTIINARGSGINETTKLFNMDIEPEKEMVIILSKEETTKAIVDSVKDRLELDKPGNGIIFVQDVSQTYGIME